MPSRYEQVQSEGPICRRARNCVYIEGAAHSLFRTLLTSTAEKGARKMQVGSSADRGLEGCPSLSLDRKERGYLSKSLKGYGEICRKDRTKNGKTFPGS